MPELEGQAVALVQRRFGRREAGVLAGTEAARRTAAGRSAVRNSDGSFEPAAEDGTEAAGHAAVGAGNALVASAAAADNFPAAVAAAAGANRRRAVEAGRRTELLDADRSYKQEELAG